MNTKRIVILALSLSIILFLIHRYTSVDKKHIGHNYYSGLLGVYVQEGFGCSQIYGCIGRIYKPLGVRASEFKFFGPVLAVDSRFAYCVNSDTARVEPIDNFDVNSLQIFENGIFKDKDRVIDAGCLPLHYRVDNQQAAFMDFDAQSFMLTTCELAIDSGNKKYKVVQDKNGVYYKEPNNINVYNKVATESGPLKVKQLGDNTCEIKSTTHTYEITKDPMYAQINTTEK